MSDQKADFIPTFESRFVDSLPGDRDVRNRSRQVHGACYSLVSPAKVSAPAVVAYSREMASLLGLDADWMSTKQSAAIFSGNELCEGMKPYATCYGGHQFGHWAGQLGDGRVINLGERVGIDGQRWTLQLKGAGPTPYSRSGDGLAVLRSSIREFLCSEAMHYLGVPTTRALMLVQTGEKVTRDMFYDGRPRQEPGAIVCRVAPSFVRFGNFELLAHRNEINILRQLADFTIENNYPHLDIRSPSVYGDWYMEICERTAQMVVHWMRVGFVHGVMNTDNMSILGQTIDYGPYGWLEGYDPDWTPNTTDASHHRYAFGNQPQIAHWNLLQLANALLPLLEMESPLQAGLDRYVECFQNSYQAMMASKLGLVAFDGATDGGLLRGLDEILQLAETDMTLFFRSLGRVAIDEITDAQIGDHVSVQWLQHRLRDVYYDSGQISDGHWLQIRAWMQTYLLRLKRDARRDKDRVAEMERVNPLYVLRNYLAQQAIDLAEQGDFSEVERLLSLLTNPYHHQLDMDAYSQKRPEWARNRAGCSTLSCSS